MFFVMMEAERRRHDARILAYRSRLLQGEAKVRTHDEADANFASCHQSTGLEGAGGSALLSCAASESDVGTHTYRVSHGMLTRCVAEVAVLCLLSKLIRFLSGVHA